MGRPLRLALPKGRVLKALSGRLPPELAAVLATDDRRLLRSCDELEISVLLLKPDDVPTYVEYGAADVGVCGRDVLAERGFDLLAPLDLEIGRCRLAVATKNGEPLCDRPRIATKYPRLARAYFAKKGLDVEVIYVQGSVELGPLTGLSDGIVDLVETGETLRANGLEEIDTVMAVSSVLTWNRAAFKLLGARALALGEMLRPKAPAV